METSGLSNNMGYRPDIPASPQPGQKASTPVVTPEKKADVQSGEKQAQLLQFNVERANTALSPYGLGVSFERDADTNSSIVRIVDRETSEVVKQYPTEGALELMKSIQSFLNNQSSGGVSKQDLTGALFNEII